MKHFAGLLLGITLIAAPAAAQTANTAAIEKQLIANERAVNEAFAKGDVKSFYSLALKDGIAIDGAGIMAVGEVEKMMASVKISTWNIENPRVIWLSPDVAVVAYRWTGAGTFQGQPIPSPTWVSTAWVKQADGKWLARFHQETPAMAAPAPAKK